MSTVVNESTLVIKATKRFFADSGMDIHSFTELLIPSLENAGLMDNERYQTGNDAETYLKARKASGVMVGRILRGTSELPLSWKWVWIETLPPQYQIQVKRDLQALSGQLSVELPGKTGSSSLSRLSAITQEFGEALAAAAPSIDGRFDESDDPEACDRYIDELFDVVERILEEVSAVHNGTGCEGRRHRYQSLMSSLKGDR